MSRNSRIEWPRRIPSFIRETQRGSTGGGVELLKNLHRFLKNPPPFLGSHTPPSEEAAHLFLRTLPLFLRTLPLFLRASIHLPDSHRASLNSSDQHPKDVNSENSNYCPEFVSGNFCPPEGKLLRCGMSLCFYSLFIFVPPPEKLPSLPGTKIQIS